MSDSLTIYRLLKKDPRYPIEAYQFVREGLGYATEVLQLGQQASSPPHTGKSIPSPLNLAGPAGVDLELSSSQFQKEIEQLADASEAAEHAGIAEDTMNAADLELLGSLDAASEIAGDDLAAEEAQEEPYEGRHLTGQELCEALRLYAVQQFGFMAISVLAQWGITKTNDFGSIVYNLIDIGLMRKSPDDRQDHFNDVYDFQAAFVDNFQIEAT
jgi:uncharacterized repeat protein (TIGR04138 family)